MRLYIHMPFCAGKCPYCGFVSFSTEHHLLGVYLQAVLVEMELVRGEEGGACLESIYIGGGTPSLFQPRELGMLLEKADFLWGMVRDAEITVEVNPATWREPDFKEAKAIGFNRFSIGAQSFNDRELRALGRAHGAQEALEAAKSALSIEGSSVGLDLIYGIPDQRLIDWKRTMDVALSLLPHHLSIYLLTPEPGTPLEEGLKRGLIALPDDDEIADMYETACSSAKEHGYLHYEVSNFALPGHASRHNLAYWKREGYLGLGPSAHSFAPPCRRWSNTVDLQEYMRSLLKGMMPPRFTEILTSEEVREEEIMLALRTSEGLSLSFFEEKEKRYLLEWLTTLRDKDLVWMNDDAFGLTDAGMLLSNEITSSLLACLQASSRGHGNTLQRETSAPLTG